MVYATATAERRFAIVCPNFYPRTCGVGDFSVRLGDTLRRRGYRVALFSRTPAEPHPDAPDLPVTASDGRLPMLIASQLAAAIVEERPTDVLVQFTPQMWEGSRFGSPAIPWLVQRLRRAGARVTLVAHELHLPWRGRPDLFAGAALQRAQLALLLRGCDRVLVTTDTRARQAGRLARALGAAQPGVIRVGPNALPVVAPRPGTGRVGVFSTAAAGKRFDVTLEAFGRIAAELPTAELVLIGDLGPPDRPQVRALNEAVARHPARARVHQTGKLPLPAVAAEIAKLDVYLFPMDVGANTRSGTLPAALGAGVPVVAIEGRETDRGLFRDGDNIAFARALEGAAFGDAALGLLRDPALAARVGAGGRRLYEQHLAWDRVVDQLLAEIG